jgi:uncharacterized protein YndB with AHSA1/START domain/quercetin dioxygenase-like cupin family protein
MSNLHEMLDIAELGIRVKVLRSAADTGGELLEVEVEGRPRGFLAQRHIHPTQTERLEMVSGSIKVGMNGREHLLNEGDWIEIPPGTPHTQAPVGDGPGTVRIQVRPAGRTQQFLDQLSSLSRERKITRFGFPRPAAAATLILEYADTGRAASPPLGVQRAIARTIQRLARPYVFVDEWDVAAPPEAVFDALTDARSYPTWWKPVYIEVEADGGAEVGAESRQHFKGRLPYHLHTRSVVAEIDPPRMLVVDVDGDLRGRGEWTLTPNERGTHVRFDWQVHADRKLLRLLTPVLRPALRANHNWAIARAMEGLEPYAQATAARMVTAS